jgi:antitoxin component of MazEF toxin-antitoxin module
MILEITHLKRQGRSFYLLIPKKIYDTLDLKLGMSMCLLYDTNTRSIIITDFDTFNNKLKDVVEVNNK